MPNIQSTCVFELLKLAVEAKVLGQFCLYILIGSRVELLGTVSAAVARHFAGRTCYVIQLSVGQQSLRVRPSYSLYVPLNPKTETSAPTHISLKGCRAVSHEGLRLRCTNAALRWRGQAAGGASTDELFEIPTDDNEDMQSEACFDEGEDDLEDA